MSFYELTEEQKDELRWTLYWQKIDDDDAYEYPDDITDKDLFNEYGGIMFTEDDFCCTANMEF